jgi:hypothetical protein
MVSVLVSSAVECGFKPRSGQASAEVLPVPSGDGFEAENSINFLGQSILFHNLFLHYETFQTELLNHFSN